MLKTITVAELIEVLQQEDPDLPVVFVSDYGDRCHTQQAHAIKGSCDEDQLRKSGYSDSGFAVADNDDPGTDDARVLVIR